MQTLLQNLRYSLRALWKQPAFTLTVLLTLALGIGATTAIYSVDYATLIEPPPYPHPEQLIYLYTFINGGAGGVSTGDYLDWVAQSHSFQRLYAQAWNDFNVGGGDRLEEINGQYVTPGFYDNLLGASHMFLGRDFLPEEGTAGKDHVVVITHKLWLHLGADRTLSTPMRINGEPYTVIGVLQEGKMDRVRPQLTLPLVFKPEQMNHTFHWLTVYGRLKDGVTLQQAQADMTNVAANVSRDNPTTNKGRSAAVYTFEHDYVDRDTRKTLWLLLGACGFLLLIACVNVANLLLARGMARQKEIAVRTALGASRSTIFAQLLTESLLLSTTGGILGVGLGFVILRVMLHRMPQYMLPAEADVRLSLPVLAVTFAITALTGVFAGYAPAWFAARVNPNESLKEGGSSGTGTGRHRLRRVLVVGEFALALALLTGAGLAIHSFVNLLRVDWGVRMDHILTFSLPLSGPRSTQPERLNQYYSEMLASIQAQRGVQNAAVLLENPIEGGGFDLPFTIVGRPISGDPAKRTMAGIGSVSTGFFSTFGVQMVKGRTFTERDNASAVRVAVISEAFAKHYFKDVDPLTQRIAVKQIIPGVQNFGPPVDWQIVGIFHTIRGNGGQADVFVPFQQCPWNNSDIAVRTTGDPNQMIKVITSAVHSVDPEIALANIHTMEEALHEDTSSQRFTLVLFSFFAAIALLLAAVGIYGVMSFSVAQRSREIALRMALGADRLRVTTLILREGVLLASIGSVFGLAGAVFINRSMQAMLFEIGNADYTVFAAVAALLLLAAIVACLIPARRAAGISPMQALKAE